MAVLASAHADILVGQTIGLTGPVSSSVKELVAGAQLYIDSVNAKGGVHGEAVRLITLDDRFEPQQAAANARELIEKHQVVALFLNRGTPHTEAIMPLLAQHRVALVAPSTGAMLLHQPINPYIFNVRSSYQAEAVQAVSHLHGNMLTRIAMVHVDDSFGHDTLQGALKGFARVGLEPVAIIKADRMKPDYPSIVSQLMRAQPQVVLWSGSAAAVSGGIKALRQAGGHMPVVTWSNNASRGFLQLLGPMAHGTIVTQVFPDARSGTYAFNREATALARAKGLAFTPQMAEGFAGAKVLVEALTRAGPAPTRQKVLTALNQLDSFDLGGLNIGYSPRSRTGLQYVTLSIVDKEGQFKY
ncbi:MAG: ABC transporter substrate-binding protein [Pseudomonadota bacterium]|nr:ABC transporter substrate-binding protein [Pseudomonadota bacterium]